MDSNVRSARNILFQELKPLCVELSQLALRDDGSNDSTRLITQSAAKLLSFLEQKCQRTDDVFDQKLADYIFFPLSQILRKKKQHIDSLSELTLKCLGILLEYGWRTIEVDLGKQLLILLTFVAGGVPGKDAPPAPEEIKCASFTGLASLFRGIGRTPGGAASLVDSGTLPSTGHCLTVVIDGMTNGPSSEVQSQSLGVLDAIWRCIKDPEALASFLPGTISGLTKFLTPTTSTRRTQKNVISAVEVLQHVLVSTLGIFTLEVLNTKKVFSDKAGSDSSERKTLTSSWLKATASQIKLALSNVIRLRKQDSLEIKRALNRLCLTLLDECHESLQDSAAMLVETSMTLFEEPEDVPNGRKTSLQDLAMIYPEITEYVKSTVYNWVTGLPRVMQTNDEKAKVMALDQLAKAHTLFSDLNIASSILEDTLAISLRDSLSFSIDSSASPKIIHERALDLNSQAAMTLVTENARGEKFSPLILQEQSQLRVREHFLSLVAHIGGENVRINLAQDMLDFARSAESSSRLAAFWLSTNLLRSAINEGQDLDEFLETSLIKSHGLDELSEELFSYSVDMLADVEEDQDWRLKAIALEVIAQTAQGRKLDFRIDLIDVLYPITQLLGSSHAQLRDHAITCLNIVAKESGYQSTSDLIIGNADYMVNAISLRLNSFDISPSAPQILVMMIRLTGPSLLLYLDDVVNSIFAALENFHGYPLLVESLFSVLSEIVSVGSSSDQLTIVNTSTSISSLEKVPNSPTMDDILSLLKFKSSTSTSANIRDHEDFPRMPWKSAKALLDETVPELSEGDDANSPDKSNSSEEVVIPPTKIYTLLHSITLQTQHHLTSSSPTLRAKLLSLVGTSMSSLPSSSPEFLPLVNEIWPVVLARLYDTEPYVQIAAAETIAAVSRAAGDFLSSRFKTEWSAIIKFSREVKSAVVKDKQGKGGRGAHTMVRKVWEGIIALFADIVGYVGVSDSMFDDILESLGVEVLSRREDIRALLGSSRGNSDAIWLELQLERVRANEANLNLPTVEGFKFVEIPSEIMV